MSRTDKDDPIRVTYADRAMDLGITVYRLSKRDPISSDSGFRKTRRWCKRNRAKAIRRYSPESRDNGAKSPYSGLKRTWDFE